MQHGRDPNFLTLDAIDHDEVGAGNDEFSGILPTWPSKMREMS
jgi:hypothetical protein